MRLVRRPRQRLEDVARVHEVLQQGAHGGGPVDRGEQGQERRPVPGEGPERLAERLMLRSRLARDPGGVGGEESEGMVRIGLVLRQVEVDAADEVPHAVPGEEVRLDAAPVPARSPRGSAPRARSTTSRAGRHPRTRRPRSGALRRASRSRVSGGTGTATWARCSSRSPTAQSRVTKSRAKSRKNPSAGESGVETSAAPRWKSPAAGPTAKAAAMAVAGSGSSAGASGSSRRRSRPEGETAGARRRSARGRPGAVTGHDATGADGVERQPRR